MLIIVETGYVGHVETLYYFLNFPVTLILL